MRGPRSTGSHAPESREWGGPCVWGGFLEKGGLEQVWAVGCLEELDGWWSGNF